MKQNKDKPCRQCPFRRDSQPGYLGDSNSDEFLETTLADHHMPCHMTIDYTDEDWKDQLANAEGCAGAGIFYANLSKLPRDRKRRRYEKDKEMVFASIQEFAQHHRKKLENEDEMSYEDKIVFCFKELCAEQNGGAAPFEVTRRMNIKGWISPMDSVIDIEKLMRKARSKGRL